MRDVIPLPARAAHEPSPEERIPALAAWAIWLALVAAAWAVTLGMLCAISWALARLWTLGVV